ANGLAAVGQYNADVLQQVGFQQPVILLGHSFAGLLAYETACALQGTNAQACQTILLDTAIPPSQRRVAPLKRALKDLIGPFRGADRSPNTTTVFLESQLFWTWIWSSIHQNAMI
ncbi:MAG: alpha/beta fold hydrolase, partial [Hyphomicrobiales bacterium]